MATTAQLHRMRRSLRAALEQAIVRRAPFEIVDGLASASGLMEVLEELPRLFLVSATIARAKRVLLEWHAWDLAGEHARA